MGTNAVEKNKQKGGKGVIHLGLWFSSQEGSHL